MTERLCEDTPPFSIGKVRFRCWAVPGGPNELGLPTQRLEWRTDRGRLAVGRDPDDPRSFWARVDGRQLARRFNGLLEAMTWAVLEGQGRAAA